MTGSRSVSSSVEVATDPMTAFTVFTEEIGCWWVQGPINFYDSARAYGKRIEPGGGGRVREVYDESSGDGLEVARITVWEPGVRLGWRSSVDDVVGITQTGAKRMESGLVQVKASGEKLRELSADQHHCTDREVEDEAGDKQEHG